jgi:hypothetical protein
MAETTITGLPNATTPLDGTERVPMDQNGVTVDASTQAIANLALADASAARTALGLAATDSPTFAGLTITGTAPVVIPHIHGSIAGNFYVHVKNSSGGELTAGTAVYATGSVGDTDRITVAACDPTDPLKMPAIGVLEATLAQNGDGDAVILGELRPFNSNSYQIRDRLYVGAGGALVATPPASGLVQAVGSVVRVNVNTGTILVNTGAAMARVGFTGAYGDLSGRPTLGTAAAASTGDFAPAAQGVTNGNSHDHNGGDGAQIAYGSLSGLPGVVSTTTAGLAPATGFGTIAYASSVALDLAARDGQVATITLTGGLELTTSNLANGRSTGLRLIAGASSRALTFPTDWVFVSAKPASIPANKVARLTIECHGATNADVVAAIAIQP